MKLFGENWQKTLNDAGMNYFKDFSDSWQKALNESGTDAFKKFAENWQKQMRKEYWPDIADRLESKES